MSDPRLTPANDRVALASVAGDHPGRAAVEGRWHSVAAPIAGLFRAPEGKLDRQVLMGERVRVLEDREGWSFGQLARDGYVGYLRSGDLGAEVDANVVVTARSTHLYIRPDIKAPALHALSFGTRLRVADDGERFLETDTGLFVPARHVRPLDPPAGDLVTVAEVFLGTPYLWGGNSAFGIDCSGLVQAACLAAGLPCPGDSDLQEAALGRPLAASEAPRRGDLYFWKGHVAIAVDAETLIHANAHHMAVACEPIRSALARIEAQGDGPPTSRRRLQALGASS